MKTIIITLFLFTGSIASLFAAVQICDSKGNCFVFDGPPCSDWSLASGSTCTDLTPIALPPSGSKDFKELSNSDFKFYYNLKEPTKTSKALPAIISSILSGFIFFIIGRNLRKA